LRHAAGVLLVLGQVLDKFWRRGRRDRDHICGQKSGFRRVSRQTVSPGCLRTNVGPAGGATVRGSEKHTGSQGPRGDDVDIPKVCVSLCLSSQCKVSSAQSRMSWSKGWSIGISSL
jgi:hypothetical protein